MTNSVTDGINANFEPIISAVAALVIVSLCFFVFVRTYWIWHMNNLRRQGLNPVQRQPTLFDVRELLVKGEKATAIKVYQKIFKVDQKEALKAVESLEKNLHQKG